MFLMYRPVAYQNDIQNDLNKELKTLQEEKDLLEQNLKLLQNPEVKEQYMREQYQLSEGDEVLFQIPLSEENEN